VTTLWDCPNIGCPPTESAPKELSVEQAVSDQPAPRGGIKKGVGPPYYWAGHQIRYRRTDVLKWFVEHTGPYARCGSECGRAFPRRGFKKVTDQQQGLST
jgi:hypothetical protein